MNASILGNGVAVEYRDMFDTILVAGGVAFFAVAVLYVLACDRM